MKELSQVLKNFWTEEEGVTVVEYAVLVALIIIALVGAIALLRGGIDDLFTDAATKIKNPPTTGTGG